MKDAPVPPAEKSAAKGRRILCGMFVDGRETVRRCEPFSQLLKEGYEVLHLGSNVKPSFFIQQMQKFSPRVVVLICQGKIECIGELIAVIKEENLRSVARIILYGPGIKETVRDEVHADAYAANEEDLNDMVREIIEETAR